MRSYHCGVAQTDVNLNAESVCVLRCVQCCFVFGFLVTTPWMTLLVAYLIFLLEYILLYSRFYSISNLWTTDLPVSGNPDIIFHLFV